MHRQDKTIEVAIFSFNRVTYLRNCVDSVKRNMPFATIRIYDDASTDPETISYLDKLGAVVISSSDGLGSKHGGLYGNMERAIEQAGADMLLMIQDDVQIVRSVSEQELILMADSFDGHGFLGVTFFKGQNFKLFVGAYAGNGTCYRPVYQNTLSRNSQTNSYADVILCDVNTLREKKWVVQITESKMVQSAREIFGPMNHYRDPFVFFCPQVPFFRDRSKSLSGRLAHKYVNGPVFFKDMDDQQIKALKERCLDSLPVAEDWLFPTIATIKRPFVYQDARALWWTDIVYGIERHFYNRRTRS